MIEHIDIEISNKFNFRFFKDGDEWVCKMPTWLIKEAEELFNGKTQFKMQTYGPYEDENGQIVIGGRDA